MMGGRGTALAAAPHRAGTPRHARRPARPPPPPAGGQLPAQPHARKPAGRAGAAVRAGASGRSQGGRRHDGRWVGGSVRRRPGHMPLPYHGTHTMPCLATCETHAPAMHQTTLATCETHTTHTPHRTTACVCCTPHPCFWWRLAIGPQQITGCGQLWPGQGRWPHCPRDMSSPRCSALPPTHPPPPQTHPPIKTRTSHAQPMICAFSLSVGTPSTMHNAPCVRTTTNTATTTATTTTFQAAEP